MRRLTLHDLDPDGACMCHDHFSNSDEDMEEWGSVAYTPEGPFGFYVLDAIATQYLQSVETDVASVDNGTMEILLVKKKDWNKAARQHWHEVQCQPLHDLVASLDMERYSDLYEVKAEDWSCDSISTRLSTLIEMGEKDLSQAILNDMPCAVLDYEIHREIEYLIGD